MHTVDSNQYIVDRRILFLFLVFLITIYYLLPTAVHAQEIDLFWQGDNYTPAFYKGRPLWSNQSRITIMAVPQIPGVANPNSLNYKWTKNNVVLGTVSGAGRNSISFNDSVLGKPVDIKLEILSSDGALLATKIVELTPTAPSLLVYEDNPLYGILFHREARSSYTLRDRETTFTAFPLFFSIPGRLSGAVSYVWRTNVGDTETKNSVTYRVPEGASGSSQVSVRAEHDTRIIQAARRSFLVEFGER